MKKCFDLKVKTLLLFLNNIFCLFYFSKWVVAVVCVITTFPARSCLFKPLYKKKLFFKKGNVNENAVLADRGRPRHPSLHTCW